MGNVTHSIAVYSKQQLAEMSSDKLALASDKYVKEMFDNLKTAKESYDSLSSISAEDDPKAKEWEKRVLRHETKLARRAVVEAITKINDYIAEQRALFSARNVEPDLAYKWAIIPLGTKTKSGAEMCAMVKRGVSLEPSYEDHDDINTRVSMALPSEKFNINRELHRGRYNDAGMLIVESACSVDRSETNLED